LELLAQVVDALERGTLRVVDLTQLLGPATPRLNGLRQAGSFTRIAPSLPAHYAQQRVLADREQEPPREALSWATTQGETKMVDNTLQPRGATRKRSSDLIVKPLGEYLPPAT